MWRTVRVFISSTFRDMHAERDHLVKVVFPELRERLEAHRVHFIDVDLRWGVTREQVENERVLDVCLKVIDECRPFFVGILGQRYGWVPRDVPLMAGSRFGSRQALRHKSVTELEILYGVLHHPLMRGHAFFYFRDPASLSAVPHVLRESVYAESDPRLARNLEDLKQRIRDSGAPVFDGYPARWDPSMWDPPTRSSGRFAGLDGFGQRVLEDLWRGIRAELQLPATPATATPENEEDDFHRGFMESRLRVCVGREAAHNRLLAYVDGPERKPLLVSGPAGCGKSTLLARLVDSLNPAYRSATAPADERLVIPHFVGASPGTSSLRGTLRRLCSWLEIAFFAHLKSARLAAIEIGKHETRARQAIEEEFRVPEDAPSLPAVFRRFLAMVPAGARVVIIVDGIDQFDDPERLADLSWLVSELPSEVRIVVSCADDGEPGAMLVARLRRAGLSELRVPPLTRAERATIVRELPSLSAKVLENDQIEMLLANDATENPLYLAVALEELRGVGAFDQITERIASLPRDESATIAVFVQVLERLEREFDGSIARSALSTLASARRGLSEPELRELVERDRGDPDARQPAERQSDLFPILRQMRPYLLRRGPLVGFHHRALYDAVVRHLLGTADLRRRCHARLAEYFARQPMRVRTPDGNRANARMADELPWLASRAGDRSLMERTLTDLEFVATKCAAGMAHELVADYEREGLVESRHQPGLPTALALSQFARFVRREAHVFACHPELVIQQARAEPAESAVCVAAVGLPSGVPCFEWVNKPTHETPCLVTIGGYAHRAFCCSISPDGRRLLIGGVGVRVFELETGAELLVQRADGWAQGCAWSPDGRWLAAVSPEGRLEVWGADTGARRIAFERSGALTTCTFSPDGVLLAGGMGSPVAWKWLPDSDEVIDSGLGVYIDAIACSPDGRHVATISQGTLSIRPVGASAASASCPASRFVSAAGCAFSPSGRAVVSPQGTTAAVWGVPGGNCERVLKGHVANVRCCAYSPCGRWIVSGAEDCTVRLWDAESGTPLATLRGHGDAVAACAFTPDGRRLVSAAADGAKVWDVDLALAYSSPSGHGAAVTACGFSPDGCIAISGSDDRTLATWDTESGTQRLPFSPRASPITACAHSPEGGRFASLGQDGTLALWDMQSDPPRDVASVAQAGGSLCIFSPDGRRLAVPFEDTVRLFDGGTGAEVARLSSSELIEVEAAAFSPDGRLLVTGSLGAVTAWDVGEGSELGELESMSGHVMGLAFSPDGSHVIAGSGKTHQGGSFGQAFVLEIGARETPFEALPDPSHEVTSCTLSPCGRRVMIGTYDGALTLVRMGGGQTQHPLRIDDAANEGRGAMFSCDGKWVLAANGGWVRLYDSDTGEALARFPVGYRALVATHPRGNRVAVGDATGTFRLLRLDGIRCDTPQVTAVHLYRVDARSYDREPTAACSWCGRRFQPPQYVTDAIAQIGRSAGLDPDQSPCMLLPSEAWNEARLVAGCPHCGQPLRLNPFVVDGRDRNLDLPTAS
jgi:telomerase protein component 1